MFGKCSFTNSGRLVRDVQHAVQAVLLHLEVDRGHHVARRQLQRGSWLGIKRVPSGSISRPPSPAHGLGDQEVLDVRVVQAGRVELDELHVRHPAARAQAAAMPSPWRCRDWSCTGRPCRAAGGQDGVRRAEGDHLVGAFVQAYSPRQRLGCCPSLPDDQVDQHVLLEHLDVGRVLHPLDQRLLHGRAGGVGHVHDAARCGRLRA